MAAQASIATKKLLTVITLTGTAQSALPRGKDKNNVLQWIFPGATALADQRVDFSYREPTATRKTAKATLRVFVPKVATDSTTGLVFKVGDNIVSMDFTFPENATTAEKLELLDMALTTFGAAEFRTALSTGDVMY
jgi:hypothetical protein